MKIKLKDKIFTYRFAKEEDIDIINKFDINIYRKVDHRIYFRHNKIKLKNMMSNGRKILLVFFEEKLVAWAGVIVTASKAYATDYDFTEKQMEEAGALVATAVSPRFRGYGLQKFLIQKRIEYLKKLKKKYALVDIHPLNKYSENNIVDFGFKFIKKAKIRKEGCTEKINHYVLKL
jgi:GNAT superfamily N-acetyltransferase